MPAIAGEMPVTQAHLRSWRVDLYVALFLVGMVLLWSVLCTVSHRSPDADNIEELVWASSFEWGYYKHPPMPTWILYRSVIFNWAWPFNLPIHIHSNDNKG